MQADAPLARQVLRRRLFPLTLALGLASSFAAHAAGATQPEEPKISGWTLTIDNDAIVPGGKDADYTGGSALTVSGEAFAHTFMAHWTDAALRAYSGESAPTIMHSMRIGLLAFTPQDLDQKAVIPADRPYASLLFVSSNSVQESADGQSAVHGGITIGVLGLPFAATVQEQLHRSLGDRVPQGWDNQVSDGGEPTADFSFGMQYRRGEIAGPFGTRIQFRDGWDASLGYETAASYGLSMRWGRYNTPWWSFSPEQIGYVSPDGPAAHSEVSPRKEFYMTLGARMKLRAYSAFLQGQFRDSPHRVHFDDLQPLIAEGWFGLNWQFLPTYTAGWLMRAQTSELRKGVGDRSLIYGGLFLTHNI